MLYAIVALLVIVLDQWTKLWVATNKDMFPRPLIDGFISLVTAQNKGIAFGLFGGQQSSQAQQLAAAPLRGQDGGRQQSLLPETEGDDEENGQVIYRPRR